ncbi:hypothetical protein D9M68_659320 [compost metagenome]
MVTCCRPLNRLVPPSWAGHFLAERQKVTKKRVDGPAGGHSYRSGLRLSYGALLRCRSGLPAAVVRHGGAGLKRCLNEPRAVRGSCCRRQRRNAYGCATRRPKRGRADPRILAAFLVRRHSRSGPVRAQRCTPCPSPRPTILSARSAAEGVPPITRLAGGLRPAWGSSNSGSTQPLSQTHLA